MLELDDPDKRLISELQRDAYRSHSELARRLGTSKTTVTRRMHRLLRAEVVRIVAVVDPDKVGLTTSALIGLEVDLKRGDSVVAQLEAKPQVHFLAVVTGRYDIVIGVAIPSTRQLGDFVRKELAAIDGVRKSETLVALEVRKHTPGLMLDMAIEPNPTSS